MPKPAFTERIQWCQNYDKRNIAGIRYGGLHTQQGPGTAASLANYFQNSQVSYHNTIDNDRNVVACVDTDDASWSVGNANAKVINYCFAGSFVEWSRAEWLSKMGNGIEIAAWLAVRDALQYKYDPIVRGWDELKAGKSGITDHRGINMGVLRTPGHTDCGDNFPWDVFSQHVERFRTQGLGDVAPQPVDNRTAIEYCRDANDWLGVKVTPAREEKTPDGKGRYVHYEKGSVYWSPDVDGGKAAFAVPLNIRAKWEKEGWEKGFLGYPTGMKLDLVPFTRTNGTPVRGGVVQPFQGGTVYSSDLGTFWVRGLVKERFASLGYETKEVGWPTSDEFSFGDANYGGSYQVFEHAQIMWFNQGNSTVALGLDDNGELTGEVLLPLARG